MATVTPRADAPRADGSSSGDIDSGDIDADQTDAVEVVDDGDADSVPARTERRPATAKANRRRERAISFWTWVMSIGALLIAFALWQLYGTAIAKPTARTVWPSSSMPRCTPIIRAARASAFLPLPPNCPRHPRDR